jgi:glutamate carboxypeptidase
LIESLSTQEKEVLQWLDRSHDAMVELLREIVNIDSGSYHKAGVDAVVSALRGHLEKEGVFCELHPDTTYGNCMRAVSRVGSGEGSPVVLMGHCDTAFPEGTAAARPFRVEGDLAYGPGVADMKGGLVINTFVLEAFAHAGVPAPLVGLYTADEEIASPSSRSFIEEQVRGARAVLNSEPGRPSGNVVTGRKGAIFLDFAVTGKPAHSGVNHQEGASAIEALCRKVVKLHGLTDYASGTTVNVGLIKGGSSVNTVAPSADASVDIRFKTMEAMQAVRHQLEGVVGEADVPGTCGCVVSERYFLPLVQSPESKNLFEHYVDAARELGFKTDGEYTGGSADSGFTAAAGIPTLCATGPVGGKVHTPDEWLRVDSLVPRAKAIALTVMRQFR